MIDSDVTLKRYYRDKGHIRLEPANSTMGPIILRENETSNAQILGVLVGVLRKC
jgi:repressor LexA